GYYIGLQRARFLAEDGSRRIEAFPDAAVPAKADKLAQLAAYAGYSYTLLGEGFCSMAIDNGPLITRTEVWTKAEDWITKSISLATWREAQLIIAEVRGGQEAIDAMNRVRVAAGLPNLSASEMADIPGTLVEERRRTLFSEGQRYNDMLRLGIPFPTGFNQKG